MLSKLKWGFDIQPGQGEKSLFAKRHGLLCAWYSHRCPLNMQLSGPHLSPEPQQLFSPCFQEGWCRASCLLRTMLTLWCSAELSRHSWSLL